MDDEVRTPMAQFMNPFPGLTPDKKLDARELSRAIRQSIAEEAVHLYEAVADATDNELVKKVMQEVADEEKVHAGEFQRVLEILEKDEKKFMEDGFAEVDEKVAGWLSSNCRFGKVDHAG